MNDKSLVPEKVRNADTHDRHRREVLWQITIPVGVGTLIILALAYLAIFPATAQQDSVWADISIIFLIVPVVLVSLLMTAMLVGSVYLTVRLIQESPFFFYKVYQWLLFANVKVQEAGIKATEPVLKLQSFTASIQQFGRLINRNK
jgi:small-conductance mechanosensitive channel